MVKPNPRASIPTSEEATNVGVHPLSQQTDKAEQLFEGLKARKERQNFQIKEIEEWKETVNALAASPIGQKFLRNMLEESGDRGPPNLKDGNSIIVGKIKSAFYLTWVRPFLSPDVRRELEQ